MERFVENPDFLQELFLEEAWKNVDKIDGFIESKANAEEFEVTAEEVNDFIQQLQEDYSPKLVREIGGLLLRIVGMAGVGYGEDVTLPKVRQKAVEVFAEPELNRAVIVE